MIVSITALSTPDIDWLTTKIQRVTNEAQALGRRVEVQYQPVRRGFAGVTHNAFITSYAP